MSDRKKPIPEKLMREHFDLEGLDVAKKYYGGAWGIKRIFFQRQVQRFIKWLIIKKGNMLLDAGCGFAFHLVEFAKYGVKGVGCDFSLDRLEQAKIHVKKEGLGDKISLVVADVKYLPFKDQVFDRVYSHAVLEHIPGEENRQRMVDEMARVLGTGEIGMVVGNGSNKLGILIRRVTEKLSGKRKRYWYYSSEHKFVYIKSPTMPELTEMFAKAKLKITLIRGMGLTHPSILRKVLLPLVKAASDLIDKIPSSEIFLNLTKYVWIRASRKGN